MAAHKYPKEERLRIGQEIYDLKLTKFLAAEKYGINPYTARDYLREYKAAITNIESDMPVYQDQLQSLSQPDENVDYDTISRDELIKELKRVSSIEGLRRI